MLPHSFFARPAEAVARDLIGTTLVRHTAMTRVTSPIVETEAYVGPEDLASHAAKGRTSRNAAMWDAPGTLYVYRVYGLHWMLNIATTATGFPAAVLIRSTESVRGPGRVAKAFAVTGLLNGLAMGPSSGLWIEPAAATGIKIHASARIGIDYAGPEWRNKKLRFELAP